MKLELYVLTGCPFCAKVLRFIEKAGIGDKVEIKNVDDPQNKKRVVEEGGQEQFPCLFIDGKPMYESMDIVKFLNDNLK